MNLTQEQMFAEYQGLETAFLQLPEVEEEAKV